MNTKSGSLRDYQVLFVGYLFPSQLEAKILDQEIRPIQTQRFGLALLNVLRMAYKNKVEVFSVAQLFDFPKCHLLIAPKAKWEIDNEISATMVPYINFVGFKHITRFLMTFFYVLKWSLKNRNVNRIIILHGVQSCKLWGTLIGQIFAPSKIVPFLTDDIGIPLKWEGVFLKNLRHLDVKLILLGLQKVSGVIAMTSRLAEKLASGRPTLIIPTIQNIKSDPIPMKNKNPGDNLFTIVYTGGLSQDYGINFLLDTFKQANRSNWRLMITGWGELEDTVRDVAASNPHVKFLGYLSREELNQLYYCADVLVNPKPTSTSFAELSFPSKIVEYLGTGRPVISTNLPVFDNNFRRHLLLTTSDTSEELIRCFDEIASWDKDKLDAWRIENTKFLQEELSPIMQSAKIRDFINEM